MKKGVYLRCSVTVLLLFGLIIIPLNACCPPECPPCQHCNENTGYECVATCDPSYCCGDPIGCQGCCSSSQCDGECCNYTCCNYCCGPDDQCCSIPCCGPHGGSQCSYTFDPHPIACAITNIDDASCLQPGIFCSWHITSGPSNHAIACITETLDDDYCVIAESVVCKNHWFPFIGIYCNCDGSPPLSVPVAFGVRKTCS